MSYIGDDIANVRNGTADRPFLFGFAGSDTFDLTQAAVVANGYLVSIFAGADDDTVSNTNSPGANSAVFVDGGSGNDVLDGTAFNDGFRDGDGNDSIVDSGGTDTAYLGYGTIFGGSVAFTASGSATNLALNGAGGSDTFSDVEFFQLADGRTFTAAQILAAGTVAADELPGDATTTGIISALQSRVGRIGGVSGDENWYSVSLTGGAHYAILLYGVSLQDAILRLHDSAGALIASDDNGALSGGNLNALLNYAPAVSGSVFLSAGGVGTNNGTYRLVIFPHMTGSNRFDAGNNNVSLASFTIGTQSWEALAGDDVVTGTSLPDRVLGGGGDDGLYGGGGDDFLHGGANEDILAGDAGNDVLEGNAGGDVLSELAAGASSGNDLLYGGDGVDIMYAAAGDDFVYGGYDSANNYADLGAGNNAFLGSLGTDVVVGGSGEDEIRGSYGDDSLYGEADNDLIFGGHGIDLLSGAGGNDQLFGDDDNDLLVGDEGNDVLDGGRGTDVLYGGMGDDIVRGGSGSGTNALYGGGGSDSFQVGAGSGGATDYIYDFEPGDRIVFQTGHFSQIAAGAPEGMGLLENYTFAGGNSTNLRLYRFRDCWRRRSDLHADQHHCGRRRRHRHARPERVRHQRHLLNTIHAIGTAAACNYPKR